MPAAAFLDGPEDETPKVSAAFVAKDELDIQLNGVIQAIFSDFGNGDGRSGLCTAARGSD